MKCKDMKKEIRKLNNELRDLRKERYAIKQIDKHRYAFNLLEIVVRPCHDAILEYQISDACKIDMRILGDETTPTVCNFQVIRRSALDLLKMNKEDFIKRMGEIMALELLNVETSP